MKAAIHYHKGGNVIMIVPTKSLKSHDLYKDILQYCTFKDDLGNMKFDDFEDELNQDTTILYFIQPELLE